MSGFNRRMIWGALFFLGVLVLFVRVASAQPTVTISAEAQDNFHAVIFTFVQDDVGSMEGCHYNLFAADKVRDIQTLPGRGISIATFFKASSFIQIIAAPLPHLARKLGKHNSQTFSRVRVYFRVLLSCPQATDGKSDIISVSVKTFAKGKLSSVRSLRKSMKYHMRYYQPS